MRVVCDDWFVALDDIGAERTSDFSVSKLDQIIDARLGKWTVITCNFTREQIAEHMDVRIASRLGRGKNVIVDNINVLDYSDSFPMKKWPEGPIVLRRCIGQPIQAIRGLEIDPQPVSGKPS